MNLGPAPSNASPEDAILYCLKAHNEAKQAVLEAHRAKRKRSTGFAPIDMASEDAQAEDNARAAGAVAFRMCMPAITGRRAAQAFIACVAFGLQQGFLHANSAKAMLYTAQLALAAHPSRRSQSGRKAKK